MAEQFIPKIEEQREVNRRPENMPNRSFENEKRFENSREKISKPEIISPRLNYQPVFNKPSNVVPFNALRSEIRIKEIENVLEEDLADIYFALSPVDQQKFKLEGEKAAAEINGMLYDVKTTIQKIADVIRRWLSGIPGINKFFIEQETKIKVDKIILRTH